MDVSSEPQGTYPLLCLLIWLENGLMTRPTTMDNVEQALDVLKNIGVL